MNKEVKNEKLVPSVEIVNQKLAILEKMHKASEVNNTNEANAQVDLNNALNEKYDFFDQEFEENGKKGLKDITGKVLVPARYHDFCQTYHYDSHRGTPVGAVDEHQKCALVSTDGQGTPLTAFEYDNIQPTEMSPYFKAYKGEKIGLIAPNGTLVVPCIIDVYYLPFNGISPIESDGKFGIITDWGLYVAPIYDEIDEKDDKPYVRKGDTWGYIDDEGHFVDENDPDLDDISLLDYFMALP